MKTIYRVQDVEGRGPWKPGFSDKWVEDRTEAEFARLVPWMHEMGPVHLNAFKGMHIGCGCRNLDQLRLWFLPGEYEYLLNHGYKAVKLSANRILGQSDIQCLFERQLPLNEQVKQIELYQIETMSG